MNIRTYSAMAAISGLVASVCLGGCFSGLDKDGIGSDGGFTGGTGDGGDGDGGDGDGEPPPEDEDEGDFRVPQTSGRYVYASSEITNRVAVIDSDTLEIDVIDVCRGPTVVEPLAGISPDEGAVAVLCQGSDEVALVRTDTLGVTDVSVRAVTPGANNLAASDDGALVFVYHDIDGPESLGPGSDQELTVIETAPNGMTHQMTVGAHPRSIEISGENQAAYVVTADGVNVIEFGGLGMIGKPPLFPVVDDPAVDPDTIEVRVSVQQGVALARVDGEPWISVTDLATAELTVVDVPGVPTDLDIAFGGSYAIVTIPRVGGSSFLEVDLPLDPDDPFVEYAVGEEYVGLSQLSNDSGSMILYTTVDPFEWGGAPGLEEDWDSYGGSTGTGTGTGTGTDTGTDTGTGTGTGTGTDTGTTTGGDTGGEPDPPPEDAQQRVTIARRVNGKWTDFHTLFVDSPVRTVGIAPDSFNAMLLHHENFELDPEARWAYTLIDLTKKVPVKKLQKVAAEPKTVLFTPDGDRGAVLLRLDPLIRRVDLVDLRTFIVDELPLGSPPSGGGYVESSGKLFVAQEHPSGRITFIDADNGVQTVTGYELNDAVKD